jgi:hypothetical protein
MISVGDLIFFLSKHTLLRACQIAQQIAARPTVYKFEFFGMYFSHQNQNCPTFFGLQSALITQAVKLQTYLAKGQSKKRWIMLSSLLQNLQKHIMLLDIVIKAPKHSLKQGIEAW